MANISTEYRKDTLPPQVRPRSVYTTHTYNVQTDDTVYQTQRFNGEYSKYLDNPPSEQWTAGLLPAPTTTPYTPSNASTTTSALWRPPPPPPRLHKFGFIPPNESLLYTSWREMESMEPAAIATPHGTMSLRLHNRIRVDMTLDRSVRVINFKNNIVVALGGTGSASALLHPNGRIYQYGSRVEILAHDSHGNNKYAKMWYKGVSFTSEQCALVYLVDSAGTRTTTDTFSDMNYDFSLPIFYNDCRHGPLHVQEAVDTLRAAQYWTTDEGIENWIINNIRISQTPDGLVRIARNSNKYQIRTSPTNGTASLTTPFLHCTASMGQTSHLFVRRGERRMHYDGNSFIVRNAGHSAGFDDKNQLKVY
ncbi:wurstfest [Lycorma delicatula]|uniref:wurstfest n=1 Tax=Lycorma delicatula TaxID=130591 RepID=UPI003F519099